MPRHRCPLIIAADHPAFAGHFPGRPILPGVVLLDEAARAIGLALGLGVDSPWRVDRLKFLRPALPGDRLILEWEPLAGAKLGFGIERAGQPLAKGIIELSP